MEKRGLEIEAKFRLKEGQREAIARRLADRFVARREQEDRYFDVGDRVLRLRREDASWVLTRKDPSRLSSDGTKIRTEIETPLPPELVEPLAETFAWLGHAPLITVRKARDEYAWEGVTVCLDRIEGLDRDFAEIEVLSKEEGAIAQVAALREQLGLTEDQIERASYARLLAERLAN
jgi:predicted adenylyl cyclase CyaB